VIERTYDTELVQSILSDSQLNKRKGDFVNIEDFDPENQKHIVYLAVSTETEVLGITVFHVFDNPIMYQGHLNYLPKFWGLGLERYTIEACKWMFDNTDCQKIIGLAPDFYPEVKKHALKCGFIEEGVMKNSTIYNNKLDNQSIMGLCKWA